MSGEDRPTLEQVRENAARRGMLTSAEARVLLEALDAAETSLRERVAEREALIEHHGDMDRAIERAQDLIAAELGDATDGAGCDSGDPVDVLGAVIRDGLTRLVDQRDEARAEVTRARSAEETAVARAAAAEENARSWQRALEAARRELQRAIADLDEARAQLAALREAARAVRATPSPTLVAALDRAIYDHSAAPAAREYEARVRAKALREAADRLRHRAELHGLAGEPGFGRLLEALERGLRAMADEAERGGAR